MGGLLGGNWGNASTTYIIHTCRYNKGSERTDIVYNTWHMVEGFQLPWSHLPSCLSPCLNITQNTGIYLLKYGMQQLGYTSQSFDYLSEVLTNRSKARWPSSIELRPSTLSNWVIFAYFSAISDGKWLWHNSFLLPMHCPYKKAWSYSGLKFSNVKDMPSSIWIRASLSFLTPDLLHHYCRH